MWKDEDHPRGQPDNKGQFVTKSDRRGYNSRNDLNYLPVGHKINLSKQEYGVLRQEVMRTTLHRRARLSQ